LYDAPANRFVAGFLGSPPMNFLRATLAAPGTLRLAATGTAVQASRVDELPVGSSIDVGVRSEDIRVVPATGTDGSGALSGVVDYVETLGSEALVSMRIGRGRTPTSADTAVEDPGEAPTGATLVARVETRRALAPGDPVFCELLPERLHFFDATSGRSLRSAAGS
jgi:multiple sugar transport system ATP-binding protein